MAEGEGFEPPVTYRPLRFSRPLPSSTRPSLLCRQKYTTPGGMCQTKRSRAICTGYLQLIKTEPVYGNGW